MAGSNEGRIEVGKWVGVGKNDLGAGKVDLRLSFRNEIAAHVSALISQSIENAHVALFWAVALNGRGNEGTWLGKLIAHSVICLILEVNVYRGIGHHQIGYRWRYRSREKDDF